MPITHQTNADGSFSPVGKTAWEEAHTLPDSSEIDFAQSGSATSRTAEEKLRAVQISPEDYGAVGDGATNDSAAFISAVARLVALGGGTLKGEPGSDYLVTAVIDIGVNDNILVDMAGCTVRTSGGDHFTFTVGGANFATSLTYYDIDPGATYEPGDMSVTLDTAAEASNFSVGDYVCIRASQDVTGLTDEPIAEYNKVASVDAGTGVITFEWPLTKDYADFSTYTFGLAVATSIISENVHFSGGKYINHGRRPIEATNAINFSIKGLEWEARGVATTGGRFVEVAGNVIKITPDWGAPAWNPFFWAVGTGVSDSSFHDNKCVSNGTGIVHVHEGQGNCSVYDNEFLLGATDSAATTNWPVISIKGRSWNTKVKDNTIINSPTTAAIEVAGSSVESGKGHYNLTISGNKIFGTVAGRGIDCDATCTNLILSDNNVQGYTTNSIRVLATGATITGNQVPSGSASIADGNEVYGNVGFVQEKVFLSQNDLGSFSGSPTIGLIGGTRGAAWLFDASSDEAVQTNLRIPKQATAVAFEVWWTNAGAGSGDVRWTILPGAFADAEDMNAADATTLAANVTAPSQDVLKKSSVGSTFAVVGEDMVRVRITRNAINVSDTLANDCGLVGVLVKYT